MYSETQACTSIYIQPTFGNNTQRDDPTAHPYVTNRYGEPLIAKNITFPSAGYPLLSMTVVE